MGIVIRQSLKASIVLLLSAFVGTINVLWLSTALLEPEQLGLIRFLLDTSLLFAAFASLGAPHIAVRFFPHFKDDQNKHSGFLVNLILLGLVGFVLFVSLFLVFKQEFLEFYVKKSPFLLEYFYYLLPFTFLTIFLNIFEAYARMHLRIVVPTIIRDLFTKVAFVFAVLFFAFKVKDFNVFVLLVTLSYLIALLALLWYIKHLKKLFIKPAFSYLNWPLIKSIASYGFYVNMAGVANLIFSKIDILMLPAMSGLTNTAVYGVALAICMVIEIPRKTITQISTPILVDSLKNNQMDKVKELYQKTSISMTLVGCFLFILIWCNIDEVFTIIPKSEVFRQGKYVVLIFALSKVFDMSTGINSEIIHQSKYYKWDFNLMIIVSILSIIGNYLLISRFGINGAALAAAFSVLVFNVVKYLFILDRFKMQPYTLKTFLLVLITASVVLLNYMYHPTYDTILGAFIMIAIKSLVLTAVFLFLVLKFSISEDFTNTFVNIIQKIRSFKVN